MFINNSKYYLIYKILLIKYFFTIFTLYQFFRLYNNFFSIYIKYFFLI